MHGNLEGGKGKRDEGAWEWRIEGARKEKKETEGGKG